MIWGMAGRGRVEPVAVEPVAHRPPSFHRALRITLSPSVRIGQTHAMPHRFRPGRFFKSFKLPAMAPVPVPEPDVPEGAMFEQHLFRSDHGQRSYRLYVPASVASDTPRGLILMLHGCTQTPEDFAIGTAMNDHAERHNLLIAYPGQTKANNANACWNWFEPPHQHHGAGEPAILAEITQEIAARHAIPSDRVFAAGLSAGGAMAAVLGEEYPQVFNAVAVHSGLPCGMAQDVMSAFTAMSGRASDLPLRPLSGPRARLIIIHGGADATVAPSNGQRLYDEAQALYPDAIHHRADTPGMTRHWLVQGGVRVADYLAIPALGHAWSGGHPGGSFTNPTSPDASEAVIEFFLTS